MANNLLNEGINYIYHENRFRNGYDNGRNVIRNKIINGGMNISQRGTTFAIPRALPDNSYFEANPPSYTIDRWFALANSASKLLITQEDNNSTIKPPLGFENYMKINALRTAYSLGRNDVFAVGQYIDYPTYSYFSNGTQNALPLTLSFMAYSEISGNFGGSLSNYSNNFDCVYPFQYNIATANTWVNILIPIDGCQIGTWNTGTNLDLYFSVGCGSNVTASANAWVSKSVTNFPFSATNTTSIVGAGANLCITGVQLEQSNQPTPFQALARPLELLLCQYYYQKIDMYNGSCPLLMTRADYNQTFGSIPLLNNMRTNPNISLNSPNLIISSLSASGVINNTNITINNTSNGAILRNGHLSYGGHLDAGLDDNRANVNVLNGIVNQSNITMNTSLNFPANIASITSTKYNYKINLTTESINNINTNLGFSIVWTPNQDITTYADSEIYPV